MRHHYGTTDAKCCIQYLSKKKCYERVSKETGKETGGKFTWKMSLEEMDHQIEVYKASIKAIEEIKEVRKLIPTRIACQYVTKSLSPDQEQVPLATSAPASASQLLEDYPEEVAPFSPPVDEVPAEKKEEEKEDNQQQKKRKGLFGFW